MPQAPRLTLPDAVREILKSFPDLIFEDERRDRTVLIRRRGPADYDEETDVVGRYSYRTYEDAQLSNDDIRDDCEAFCQEKQLPYFPAPAKTTQPTE